MTTTTTNSTVINRQDPAIEAYRLGLLGDVQGYIRQQIASGDMPPDYQVAGLAPSEQAAIAAARSGIGSYQPYINQGSGTIDQGRAAMLQGIGSLQGTGAMYDPNAYEAYMNPYEDQAVQMALSDIQRAGDVQRQGVKSQAVGSGAFGGSRGQLAESELDRNTMQQQANTAAQMRAAGYQNAQQQAMGAFDSAMGRRQNIGQLTGQMATGLGQLGIQQAGLGEMASGLATQDINNLLTTGATQRGVQQAGLDALRLTNLQRYSQPYQQYGFLSDIYSGVPTSQATMTSSSAPQVSPFQTTLGLGISGLAAASGAQNAGLF
ncbi:MAG: hypothetical protein GY776_18930 [Alteromonas sp.]|nr:hypothetical protein [Alteromonas sp.]